MGKEYKSVDDYPSFLTVDELASVFRISRASAYAKVNSKYFPAIKMGKRIVVPKEDLLVWIEKELENFNGYKRESSRRESPNCKDSRKKTITRRGKW